MGRRVLRGTRIPGPKVFASIVTEGAENEFVFVQLTDVSSILSQDMFEIAKVVFKNIQNYTLPETDIAPEEYVSFFLGAGLFFILFRGRFL